MKRLGLFSGNNMSYLTRQFPEYYLLVLVLFSGYSFPLSIDPLSVLLAGILIFQIKYKNPIVAVLIACLLPILTLFMLAALVSEMNDFYDKGIEVDKSLFFGFIIVAINLVVTWMLIFRFVEESEKVRVS